MNPNSKQKEKIASMFDDIATEYDVANHFLSLGIDKRWRKKIKELILSQNLKSSLILDIATGTGDLAFDLATIAEATIIGMDISEKMLDCARQKNEKRKHANLTFLLADGTKIPFNDNSFDVVTVAFGVRNFENFPNGIHEIHRVLKPNGHYYVLELTRPQKFLGPFYNLYLTFLLPILGWIITRKKSAYIYLRKSIQDFYQDENLNEYFLKSGFDNCKFKHLSGGIATLYFGEKHTKKSNID